MRLIATCVAIVAGAASALHGGVEFATPFTDGCVLQRDVPVAVWGTAEAGERVQVSFGGQSVASVADEEGRWSVRLAPMPACSEGRVLSANGICINDVLVGEVWLCAGQSNAELPLCGANPRYRDKTGALVAAMTRKPLVRLASMSSESWSAKPRSFTKRPVRWKPFTPENLNGGFSALGVYFALELHSALNVPVGVIGAYQGSTPIESWIPPAAFESRPKLKGAMDSMMKALAVDLGPHGVRVNMVAPGYIWTDRWQWLSDEIKAARRANVPTGMEATGRDVAEAVAFFASDAARACQGARLVMDGGSTVQMYPPSCEDDSSKMREK